MLRCRVRCVSLADALRPLPVVLTRWYHGCCVCAARLAVMSRSIAPFAAIVVLLAALAIVGVAAVHPSLAHFTGAELVVPDLALAELAETMQGGATPKSFPACNPGDSTDKASQYTRAKRKPNTT